MDKWVLNTYQYCVNIISWLDIYIYIWWVLIWIIMRIMIILWYIWFNDSNDNDNHRDRLHKHIERDVGFTHWETLGKWSTFMMDFPHLKIFWKVNVALLKLAKRDKNIQELCKIQKKTMYNILLAIPSHFQKPFPLWLNTFKYPLRSVMMLSPGFQPVASPSWISWVQWLWLHQEIFQKQGPPNHWHLGVVL